jgi:hypothetical protein
MIFYKGIATMTNYTRKKMFSTCILLMILLSGNAQN